MIINAAKQISDNIHKEFEGIHSDVLQHIGPTVSVDHSRELLSHHVPSLVIGRAQALLDTLLNYLMEDAMVSLSNAPTKVKNDFYALDLRKSLMSSFKIEPQTFKLSWDPRKVLGGAAASGTLLTGGLIVGIVFESVVSRIIAGLATLAASALAFHIAHAAGTKSAYKKLESDVSFYLSQSEKQVSEWLSNIQSAFAESFDKFALDNGVQCNEVS